ncbi:hypothetical protein FOZ60_017615 [Perkinsus olseni]|uniref:Uncharacterized protein n=1 Tax=Perkinsus olseni TaxID=32597 RepID=A0A7J6NDF5_PEROL|nr:hypothetical protein FOZ60_017615 [Perkinsus olseni]
MLPAAKKIRRDGGNNQGGLTGVSLPMASERARVSPICRTSFLPRFLCLYLDEHDIMSFTSTCMSIFTEGRPIRAGVLDSRRICSRCGLSFTLRSRSSSCFGHTTGGEVEVIEPQLLVEEMCCNCGKPVRYAEHDGKCWSVMVYPDKEPCNPPRLHTRRTGQGEAGEAFIARILCNELATSGKSSGEDQFSTNFDYLHPIGYYSDDDSSSDSDFG